MVDKKRFGEKLKELRKNQGRTQKELAEYLNLSEMSVSKWERGVSMPESYYLNDIADFLNTSLDELFSHTYEVSFETISEYKDGAHQLDEQKKFIETIDFCRQRVKMHSGSYACMELLIKYLTKYLVYETINQENKPIFTNNERVQAQNEYENIYNKMMKMTKFSGKRYNNSHVDSFRNLYNFSNDRRVPLNALKSEWNMIFDQNECLKLALQEARQQVEIYEQLVEDEKGEQE